MHRYISRLFVIAIVALPLSGCSQASLSDNLLTEEAAVTEDSVTGKRLQQLPVPKNPVVLAVYSFEDKTGQHKPSDDFPEYSRAVTQGGTAILNKALYDAGKGSWFRVLERKGVNNLNQERKIIRSTRQEYGRQDLGDIGPLLYASFLLEGGIVAYETNVVTGGAGARYLGVGGDTQYRRDVVTVALRAVSVLTGEVVLAINASKTIFSTSLRGSVNKFVAIDELLEIESGFSLNEPPQYAVRQAIEMAVYSMVVEGAIKGLWEFSNPTAGRSVIREYLMKRDRLDEDDPALPAQHVATPTGALPVTRPVPPAVPATRRPVVATVRPAPVVRTAPASQPVPKPAPIRSKPAVIDVAPTPQPRAVALPPVSKVVAPPPPAQPLRAATPRSLPSLDDLPPPPRYDGGYRETPRSPVIQQLPPDAKPNPNVKINGLSKALEPDENDPQNFETLERYERQGVVYCGPSGCVPSDKAPVGR